jgi:hypothetical protein
VNLLALVQIVAALAGAPSNVQWSCTPQTPVGDWGYALSSPPQVELAPNICEWLHERWKHPGRYGVAVHVVIHEASHETGLWTEYAAEERTEGLVDGILRTLYHNRFWRQLRQAEKSSEHYHDSLPPQYLTPSS